MPNQNASSLSARTIWGKVVIFLREKHEVAMHMACGDITDVKIENGCFKIFAEEQFLLDLLLKEANNQVLKEALLNCGVTNFEVVKKEKTTDKALQDIEKLKQIFGKKFEVQ